ncbi:MAG: alpha/beta fold hydrolase [Paracoccaceae bacterium]
MGRFTHAGVGLHFEDAGAGPAVLALSGLTRSTRDFDFVAPHLPCRLIRMDTRGRGESDWADWRTYTVAQEAADALALLDHLGLERAAILGTSRGGLIAMWLAATAKDRLTGVALNDIGPVLDAAGLGAIADFIGKPPVATTLEGAAQGLAAMPGFDVPLERWRAHAANLLTPVEGALRLRYDPLLREAMLATPMPDDLWGVFDAMDGLPLAAIRGANSDLLSAATFARMQARRPDMIAATVPGRAHVPFLDEAEALAALRAWVARL